MLHTMFPPLAGALATWKLDRSLFKLRVKDQPHFLPVNLGLEGAWLLLWLRPPLPHRSHPLHTGIGRT